MACRVLMICGSLQAASANRAALDVAASYLAGRDDVVVEHVELLADVPAFDPDRDANPDVVVERFRAQIARGDVVLIATPEYAGGVAGALKNALDWIVGSGELYTKPVVVISAGTTGGAHARRQLIQTLTWQGAHVVGQLGIAAPRTKSDAASRYTDPTTIEEIEQLARLATDAALMDEEDRLALVRAVTSEVGIEPGHIAPAP